MIVLRRQIEAIEHHFRGAVRLVVAILVRDEEQLRWRHEPHTAEPDLDARKMLHVVEEDRAACRDVPSPSASSKMSTRSRSRGSNFSVRSE
jgi:hypothetical protein